jgi:hypothetical protein
MANKPEIMTTTGGNPVADKQNSLSAGPRQGFGRKTELSSGGAEIRIVLGMVVALVVLFFGIPWIAAEASVQGLVAQARSQRPAFQDAIEPLRRLIVFAL